MNTATVTGIQTHQFDSRNGITSVRQKRVGHSERVLFTEKSRPIQK